MKKAIVCPSCGARFALPAPAPKEVSCPECGTLLTLARREPASEDAAQEEAPRKSSARRQPAKRDSARAGSARREAPKREAARHGQREPAKSSNKALLWLAGVGGIAVLALVVVWLAGSGSGASEETGQQAAQQPLEEHAAAGTEPGASAAETPPAATDPDPSAAAAPAQAAPAQASPAEAARTEAAAEPASKGKPPVGKRLITSPDQVYDPKALEPVPAPADVTEEEKGQMDALLTTMRESGAPGKRAGKQLAELGHKAMFKIVNQLRELDYTKASDTMFAYELNMLLEEMLLGANAGFKPPVLEDGSEAVDLQAADFNAQTVYVWHTHIHRWDTKEELDAYLQDKRAARAKAGDDK
jgi:hypothetical protein